MVGGSAPPVPPEVGDLQGGVPPCSIGSGNSAAAGRRSWSAVARRRSHLKWGIYKGGCPPCAIGPGNSAGAGRRSWSAVARRRSHLKWGIYKGVCPLVRSGPGIGQQLVAVHGG